jgi:hypothetical protein
MYNNWVSQKMDTVQNNARLMNQLNQLMPQTFRFRKSLNLQENLANTNAASNSPLRTNPETS